MGTVYSRKMSPTAFTKSEINNIFKQYDTRTYVIQCNNAWIFTIHTYCVFFTEHIVSVY